MSDEPLANYAGSVTPDGGRVKLSRELKGWDQAALAKHGDCSKKSVENIEASKLVKADTLRGVAAALGVTLVDLLSDECKRKLLLSCRTATPPPAGPPAPSVSIPSRLNQLPRVLDDFIGRTDAIAEIAGRLSGGGKVGLSALRGMGGVGKTSLAVRVAHEVSDQFQDGVLFLELHGVSDRPPTVGELMARVVRDFHPDAGKLPAAEAELLLLYRGVLAGKRALLVLDNARDEAQVRPLLTAGPAIAFLITSRKALALEGVKSVCLDVLPPDEALALLRSIVDSKGTNEELRAVAELCGRLPLALRVAGSFLAIYSDWTPLQYISVLQNEPRERIALPEEIWNRDVNAILAHSINQLQVTDARLAARWATLAISPGPITRLVAAAVWNVDKHEAHDNLSRLTALSLLHYDESMNSYSMHPLLEKLANRSLDKNENEMPHNLEMGRSEGFCNLLKYYIALLSGFSEAYMFHARVHDVRNFVCKESDSIMAVCNAVDSHIKDEATAVNVLARIIASGGEAFARFGSSPRYIAILSRVGGSVHQIDNIVDKSTISQLQAYQLQIVWDFKASEKLSLQSLHYARSSNNSATIAWALIRVCDSKMASINRGFCDLEDIIKYFTQALSHGYSPRTDAYIHTLYSRYMSAIQCETSTSSHVEIAYTILVEQFHDRSEYLRKTGYGPHIAINFEQDDTLAISHKEVAKIALEEGDRHLECQALMNAAFASKLNKDFDDKLALYIRAAELAKSLGSENEAGALWHVAWCYNDLGQHAMAKSFAYQAILRAKEIDSNLHKALADRLKSFGFSKLITDSDDVT